MDPSSLAFVATFIIAFTTTLLNFIWVEDDIKKKSDRPIYIYLISFLAWFISIGFLGAQTSSTLIYPAQVTTSNTFNGVAWTNTITTTPAYNVTAISNKPLTVYTFYEWMSFAGAMGILNIVFLVLYMLRRSTSEIGDVLDDLGSKK